MGIWKSFRNFFSWTSKTVPAVNAWRVFLLFFIILVTTITAGVQSAQQGSLVPLIISVGGRLFNADALLYHHASQPNPLLAVDDIDEKIAAFENATGFFNRIQAWFESLLARATKVINVVSFYLNILLSVYTMVMMFFVFAWLVSWINNSQDLFNYGSALVLILLLGGLYGSFVFQYDYNGQQLSDSEFLKSYADQVNPVKGTVYLIKNHESIIGPLMGETSITNPTPLIDGDTNVSINRTTDLSVLLENINQDQGAI